MRNNFKVVVVEKLVNTSRPMRRSIVMMKEHSCSLFGPFFQAILEDLHKSHPSLLYCWERNEYHAFAIPKHGYHHFLSTGSNPKFLL